MSSTPQTPDSPQKRPVTSQKRPVNHSHDDQETTLQRKKYWFVAIAVAMILGIVLALVTFVSPDPEANKPVQTLPSNSVVGWWTNFCPAHNTIAADADALNIRENEKPEDYSKRLAPSLDQQAADFRSAALILHTSSVMLKGSEQQKSALRELINVMYEGDKVFSEQAEQVRNNPPRTQADMDAISSQAKIIFEKYAAAVKKAVAAVGMGDPDTRARIMDLSECKQLLSQDKPQNQS